MNNASIGNDRLNFILNLKKAGFINDTHRRNTHSNKTQALTKSVNMDISVVGIFNQLFVTGFYTQKKNRKNK